jgi:hypothetical protein
MQEISVSCIFKHFSVWYFTEYKGKIRWSASFYQTTRRNISEDRHFHTRRLENPESQQGGNNFIWPASIIDQLLPQKRSSDLFRFGTLKHRILLTSGRIPMTDGDRPSVTPYQRGTSCWITRTYSHVCSVTRTCDLRSSGSWTTLDEECIWKIFVLVWTLPLLFCRVL